MEEVDLLAQIIWDYMHMNHTIVPSDCILVFGSSDLSPAHRACDLFLLNYGKVIVFSGNYGETKILGKSEAETYADMAYKRGIVRESVFIENKSRNTGENATFSKELIIKESIPHKRIILVQKPYMERRAYATFKAHWPEQEVLVTSPQISYVDYTTNHPHRTKERILNVIVGDLQRIKEYPKLGFQIEQKIPDDVWEAYEKLVDLGYNKCLIK